MADNLLGGLQFGAKAAEVWFMFVAISLVYQITSLLARSEHGLPIGYLTTYVEFTDIMYLFKSTLWTSAYAAPGQKGLKRKRRTMRYSFFALLVAFLTLISNLVGPLYAVLMIPSLNWVDMDKSYQQRFGKLLSDSAPTGNNTIFGCEEGELARGEYNCTSLAYRASLDAFFEYTITDVWQSGATYLSTGGNITGIVGVTSKEEALGLRFNYSQIDSMDNSTPFWAPNRQVVRLLTKDLVDFYSASANPTSVYASYNNSLQLTLQRQGPIVGYQWSYIGTNVTETTVAADKRIRCYQNYFYDKVKREPWAKCFRVGTGWNATNAYVSFTLGKDNPYLNSTKNDSNILNPTVQKAFYSDKATWVQTNLEPGDMPPCLPNGTAPTDKDCDYNAMFTAPVPSVIPQNLTNQTYDSFVVENSMLSDPSIALVIDAHYTYGFTTYAADVSAFSTSWGVVEIGQCPFLLPKVFLSPSTKPEGLPQT